MLLVDEVQGADAGEEGLITSRREAVVRYAHALNIEDYIEMDDNIDYFHVSPNLIENKTPSTWADIYTLFKQASEIHKSSFVSARTYRPNYDLPSASDLLVLKEDSIGSKIAYTKNRHLKKVVSEEQLGIILPKKDVWGDDVYKWRMYCRLGLEPKVLDFSVISFSRVHGGVKGACAKSLNKTASYWLEPSTKNYFHSSVVSELEKAVYYDMRQIVEMDINDRTSELAKLDTMESSERTKRRFQLLKAYNLDYSRVISQLFQLSNDEEELLQLLKGNNGYFRLGNLPTNFFSLVDSWLKNKWIGTNGGVARDDVKIRLIFEAVIYLGYSLDNLQVCFNTYRRNNPSFIPEKTSQLYDLLLHEFKRIEKSEKEECPSSMFEISDDALKTFLRFKELEMHTPEIEQRPPYESKEVMTFVMLLGTGKICLEPITIVFDNMRRMKQIYEGGVIDSFMLHKEIGVQVEENLQINGSTQLVIESLKDCRTFIRYFEQKGKLKIGQYDLLLLPIKYSDNQSLTSKRKRKSSLPKSPKQKNSTPAHKKRKTSLHLSNDGEVQGLSCNPVNTTQTINSGSSTSSNNPTISHQSIAALHMNNLGFFKEQIELSLSKALRAIVEKERRLQSSTLKDIPYDYSDKVSKILFGDVSLQDIETRYVLDHKLKSYQRESVDAAELAWKSGLNGFLLASEMGTGKTLIMMELALRRIIRGENVLFVGPDAILGQIRSEMIVNLTLVVIKAIEEEKDNLKSNGNINLTIFKARNNTLSHILSRFLDQSQKSQLTQEQKNILKDEITRVKSTITVNIEAGTASTDWLREHNPLAMCDPFTTIQEDSTSPSSTPYSHGTSMGVIRVTSSNKLNDKMNKLGPSLVIFDEASRLHSRTSNLYSQFLQALDSCQQEPNVLLATGTPLENNLSELSTLIHCLISSDEREKSIIAEKRREELLNSALKSYKDASKYLEEALFIQDEEFEKYLEPILESFIAQEVFKLVTNHLFYRVTKREDKVLQAFNRAVPKEVPLKRFITLDDNHSEKVEETYLRFKKNDNKKISDNFLKIFHQAGNILVHPIFASEDWDVDAKSYNKLAEKLSHHLASCNEEQFEEFINQSKILQTFYNDINSDTFRNNCPAIVFVESTAVGHIIKGILARKFGCEKIAFMTGDDKREQKTAIQNRFKNNQLDALVLNYKTGGVGLDLKNGKALMIIQKPFNPGLEMQAKARNNRVGNEGEKPVYEYTTKTSVSRHLEAIHLRKKNLFSYIFDESETSDGSVNANRTPLSEENFKVKLDHFINMLLAMIDSDGQTNPEKKEILNELKDRFITLTNKEQVITSFKNTLPVNLWPRLRPYTIHPLPAGEKGEDSFYKVLEAYFVMREHQVSLNRNESIPKKYFDNWKHLKNNWMIRTHGESRYQNALLRAKSLDLHIIYNDGKEQLIKTRESNSLIKVLRRDVGQSSSEYRLCIIPN
ncbi:MAG: DEAD/DEAH box helicase [Chlamydiota bacterium]